MYFLTSLTPVEEVTAAAGGMLGLVETVLDTIIGNPILIAILSVSFIGIGIAIFSRLKRAAR